MKKRVYIIREREGEMLRTDVIGITRVSKERERERVLWVSICPFDRCNVVGKRGVG